MISHLFLATVGRDRFQINVYEIWGGKNESGTSFSPDTSVFACQYHSTKAQYSTSPAHCSYQNDKRSKPGNITKSNAFAEIGGVLYFFFLKLILVFKWLGVSWRKNTLLFNAVPDISWVREFGPVSHLNELLSTSYFFLLWFCGQTRRFLDDTQRRAVVGRIPPDEPSSRCIYIYLTTQKTHNRQISMPPVGFEPTIPVSERPQTHALDSAATVP